MKKTGRGLCVAVLLCCVAPWALAQSRTGTIEGEDGYYFTNDRDRNPTQGGFVSYEADVQEGTDVFIGPNAVILGSSSIQGRARIYGNAVVKDAEVIDRAKVYGDARVIGNVFVSGEAKIYGNAYVHTNEDDELSVSGQAKIYGDAEVTGNVEILDKAKIAGNAVVRGDAVVGGTAIVRGETVVETGEVFEGTLETDATPPEITLQCAWFPEHIEVSVRASEPLEALNVGGQDVLTEAARGPWQVRVTRGSGQVSVVARDASGNEVQLPLPQEPGWTPGEAQLAVSREREVPFACTSAGLELVLVPAGSFTMGSPPDESGRGSAEVQHRVSLSRSVYLARTEVTQGAFEALMGFNPASNKNLALPVESVTWYDAIAFCNALSLRDGLEPAYSLQNLRKNGESISSADVTFHGLDSEGYRLPTEAEWEYACRAGTTAARYGDLDSVAWHAGNSGSSTHAVGLKAANAWGLYDMLGNVWEWCWDGHADYAGDAVDPLGAGPGASHRVYRGGSWNGGARNCRSANRYWYEPGYRYSLLGFRPARSCP